MLIEYNLKNKLNTVAVLNNVYLNKDKYLNAKVPKLNKKIMTKTINKIFNEITKRDRPVSKETIKDYTFNDKKIDDYSDKLELVFNTKDLIASIEYKKFSYHDIFNNINIKNIDTDANDEFRSPLLVKTLINILRKINDKNYNDVESESINYILYEIPKSLRTLYTYQFRNKPDNWLIVDKKYKFMFTLKAEEDKEYKKYKNNKNDIFNINYINEITFYKYSEQNADAIIAKDLLNNRLHQTVGNDEVIDNLLKLWQFQLNAHKSEIENEGNFNLSLERKNEFINFLVMLLESQNEFVENEDKIKLTYLDLINFYQDVQNNVLTLKSNKVIEYFNSTLNLSDNESVENTEKIKEYIQMISHNDNFVKVNKEFEEVDKNNTEVKNIINTMNKDKHFKNDYDITKVFKINNQNDSRDLIKYPNHFIGIHGTKIESLPSILLNGLKNHDELEAISKEDYIKYYETGQSVGMGVYFAALNQPSKSTNFIGNDKSYLVIADVAYDDNTKYSTNDKSKNRINKKDASLIFSPTGGVRGLDEYVAPYSNNIQTKYIVEINRVK